MESKQTTGKVDMAHIFSEEEISFDFYSCEEAITRLNDFLDHELNDEERSTVVKHLQICRPCLERFHFEESLITSLRAKVSGILCPDKLRSKLNVLIRGGS